ncbi:aminodeoxychorismate/anthranilate synthase component II [Clostridium estertheticum]|uniref:anthranilate synthase component II n=1 Tax=Clostridium estertheticum TaxID=238834 RepID=UPI001C7CD793|nr:aminodeoxychorismate/anthranilate synthase component II [Clostridium estertheticum]MBX4260140.1 aminodeoxychorismate/anthranilate synthase component II [Clostridium estertheticum]WLC72149.1 aminodeoxychorismate/anthranilate synthase component II [Clostridium estertheticum]
MILIIDNYDSFTYNLYQYVGELYKDVKVLRNDEFTIKELKKLPIEGIIISPGPGRPENAGLSVEVIKAFEGIVPIIGICLGHQAIGYAYGSKIIKAPKIMHGKTSIISHNRKGLFNGLKDNLKIMRYHSLIVEKSTLSKDLEITAQTKDGLIMAIKHNNFQTYGLQFHPESIFSEGGKEIIKNFVEVIFNVKDGAK